MRTKLSYLALFDVPQRINVVIVHTNAGYKKLKGRLEITILVECEDKIMSAIDLTAAIHYITARLRQNQRLKPYNGPDNAFHKKR